MSSSRTEQNNHDLIAQAQIEKALRALPRPPMPHGTMAYVDLIPEIARQIALLPKPSALKAARRIVLADLRRTHKLTAGLLDRIGSELDLGPAKGRAPILGPHAEQLRSSLSDFLIAIKAAQQRYSYTVPSKYAGSRKPEACRIGCRLYVEYELITGKKPTRIVRDGKSSGTFQSLLESVFDAMGVDASPESTAVKVMEKMKNKETV